MNLQFCSVLAVACLLLSGCGSAPDWQVKTHPAHGTITINNSPPAGAVVELRKLGQEKPDARNSRPWAVVEDDGAFHLGTYAKGDGAPAGDYAITVRWPPVNTQFTTEDKLNGAYSKPEVSQWKVTIKEGDNALPPIAITGIKLSDSSAAGQATASQKKKQRGPPLGRRGGT